MFEWFFLPQLTKNSFRTIIYFVEWKGESKVNIQLFIQRSSQRKTGGKSEWKVRLKSRRDQDQSIAKQTRQSSHCRSELHLAWKGGMRGHCLLCCVAYVRFSRRGVRFTSSAGISFSPSASLSAWNALLSASSNGVLPSSLPRLVLLMWLSSKTISSCVYGLKLFPLGST